MSFTCLAHFSDYEVQLSIEDAMSAHHRGDCEESCTAVVKGIREWSADGLGIPRQGMIDGLLEYGTWDKGELEAKTDEQLEVIIVWLVSGDIQDAITEVS